MLWRVRFFKYGRTCYSFSTGNSLLSWPPPCIVWRGKLSAKLNCITDHRSRGHCLPFARPKNQAHGLKVEGVGFQLVIHCRGVPFSQKHCFNSFQEYLRIIQMISFRMFPVNNSMNIQVTQSIHWKERLANMNIPKLTLLLHMFIYLRRFYLTFTPKKIAPYVLPLYFRVGFVRVYLFGWFP
jgi:hypothetical protein